MPVRLIASSALLLILVSWSSIATESNKLKFVYTYEGKTFEHLIARFAAQENIEVERLWSAQGDLRVNLIELIERNSAPDVVLIPADHIGQYRLMNYSAVAGDLVNAKVASNLWQSVSNNNVFYGVPIIQGNHLMLYYNKRLVNNVADTWAELLQQKKRYQADTSHETGEHFMAWSYDEMYWFVPFYGAFGGQTLTDGKITLDNEAMAQALDFYKNLKDEGLPESECNYDCARRLFISGNLAYTVNGDWAFKEFREKLGDDLGIAMLPAISSTQPLAPYYSTHALAFPNNSLHGEKQKELIKLITFFQSKETQKHIWKTLGVLPVESSVINTISVSADSSEKLMLSAMKHAIPMPTEEAMTIVWSALRKGMLRHQMGVLNAKEASKLMQKIADKQQAHNENK